MMGGLVSLITNWRLVLAGLGAVVLVSAGVFGAGYLKGRSAAAAKCQTEALEAKVKKLEADADRIRQAQEKASLRAIERSKESQTLMEKVRTYEATLKTQPECVLTADDIDGMP